MNKFQTNPTVGAAEKKSFNGYKVAVFAIGVITILILGAGVFTLGFTTKGHTMVRVMIDHQPAADAYAAQDEWNSQFKLQVANPKAE